MTEGPLDTAHQFWDRWWGEASERTRWSQPEPTVLGFIPALQARGVHRLLDVGAGIGRHTLAYARAGFEVIAVDASATGLERLTHAARAERLDVTTHVAAFSALPIEANSVDHVLAWNVIYHGDRRIVATALAEIHRVLRRGGTLQLTMLSKRNRAYGVGRQVRPDTFVDEASSGDKDHPHFYVDALDLRTLLADAGFELLSLADVDQDPPGGWHWAGLAELALG